MDKTIETVRLMADGQHPGVIGENARAELAKVARLLGECQTAMASFVDEASGTGVVGREETARHVEWFRELLA